MNVSLRWSTHPELALTTPFPSASGVLVRVLAGDVCDPIRDPDGWYGPIWPLVTLRFKAKRALFIALRVGPVKGYIGAKVYGYIPEYQGWWPQQDCKEGSRAMCFSFRPFSRERG